MLLELVNKVLQPVLWTVLPVLVVFVIAYLKKLRDVEQAKLSEKQIGILDWLISTGIWAAEQAYKSGLIPKELREDYVIKFIQAEADKHHLVIDVEMLAIRIKAAVAREFNRDRLLGTSVGLITTVEQMQQMSDQAIKHANQAP